MRVTPLRALVLYVQQAGWSEPSHISSHMLTARHKGMKTTLRP